MFPSAHLPLWRRPVLILAAALPVFVIALPGASHARAQAARVAVAEVAGSSFKSSFNGSKAGWQVVAGTWKLTPTGFYQGLSTGASLWDSVAHKDTYTNFTYTARFRKKSGEGQIGLIVRGDPASLSDPNLYWNTGYVFKYANDTGSPGNVAVDKRVGGIYTALMGWQNSAAVVNFGWNVLRVDVYGPNMAFYVNGKLVFGFQDPSPIPSGQVGIGTSTSFTGEKTQVDWVTLKVIPD